MSKQADVVAAQTYWQERKQREYIQFLRSPIARGEVLETFQKINLDLNAVGMAVEFLGKFLCTRLGIDPAEYAAFVQSEIKAIQAAAKSGPAEPDGQIIPAVSEVSDTISTEAEPDAELRSNGDGPLQAEIVQVPAAQTEESVGDAKVEPADGTTPSQEIIES